MVLSQGLPAAEGEGPAPVDAPDSGSESAQRDTDQPVANESPEQARRRKLAETHGAEIADAILAGTVIKEMTTEQVILARGEPIRKEVIPPDAELWHYPGGEVAFSPGQGQLRLAHGEGGAGPRRAPMWRMRPRRRPRRPAETPHANPPIRWAVR